MKIALVSFSNNYDMQEYLYSLYDQLKTVDDEIFTFGSKDLKTKIEIENNNYLFNVPNRPGIEVKTFNFIELINIISRLMKFDAVYFISSHAWNFILIKLLKNKIKIIHSIHDPFPHENEKMTNNVLKYNKYIVKNCDSIVLHNEKMVEDFKIKYDFFRGVIYIPLWRKWRSLTNTTNSNRVLFFGRVNPYKGIENILFLAKELKKIEFHIVGKFSDEMKKIKDELQSVENITVYDKYVSEIEMDHYFYNADITIIPYTSATQSGVIIESYRHSRPVIAYNVGAIIEQVNENTGILIKENDKFQMKEKLVELLNLNEKEKNNYCKDAWQFGKDMYSPEKACECLMDCINENITENKVDYSVGGI